MGTGGGGSYTETSKIVLFKLTKDKGIMVSQVAQWQRIHLPTEDAQETEIRSLRQKIPWSRKWQPTPVFLPGKSLGQKSLAGYHPGGCKELDMTEQLILTSQHVTKKIWWDWFICLVPKSDVNYQSIGQFEGTTDDKEKGMAIHSSILACRIP